MTAHTSRRFLSKLARGLIAVLPVMLVLASVQAKAAPSSAGGAKNSSHQKHHHEVVKTARKKRSRRSHRRYAPAVPSDGMRLGLRNTPDSLSLKSSVALVVDQDTGETLAIKNPDVVLPIASLTKLMTALVVVEAGQRLDEELEIASEDVDTEKHTHSRLTVGTRLTRDELLLLALMSSENRAAMALSRHYPGGRPAFVAKMNQTAKELGMTKSHFADPAGLSKKSVSTARDLSRLITAVDAEPLIRTYSTQTESVVSVRGRNLTFVNSNRLVRKSGDWDIGLQKTGFTNEAGRCLVMQANVLSRRLAMIFLDSTGTLTRYADAARVRQWLERESKTLATVAD